VKSKARAFLPLSARSTPSHTLVGTSWQLVKFQGNDDTTRTPDDRSKYTIEIVKDGHLFLSLMADCGIYEFEPIAGKNQ
jgi:hypothetical protein